MKYTIEIFFLYVTNFYEKTVILKLCRLFLNFLKFIIKKKVFFKAMLYNII